MPRLLKIVLVTTTTTLLVFGMLYVRIAKPVWGSSDVSEGLVGLLLIFGLRLLGLLLLIVGGSSAKSFSSAATWGLISAILMVLQCLVVALLVAWLQPA